MDIVAHRNLAPIVTIMATAISTITVTPMDSSSHLALEAMLNLHSWHPTESLHGLPVPVLRHIEVCPPTEVPKSPGLAL